MPTCWFSASLTACITALVVSIVPRHGAAVAPLAAHAAPPARPTGEASSGRTRTFTVDEALKELELIRSARPKLAPDFALKMPDGKTFRLSEHRGKIVFVNFWATWCKPCREEMPAMERLYQKHRDKAFVMVAVSVDSDVKAVTPFVREHKLTFPIALDTRMDAANAYGVRALPSTFIVDRKGMTAALALGPRPWDNAAAHALIEGLTR